MLTPPGSGTLGTAWRSTARRSSWARAEWSGPAVTRRVWALIRAWCTCILRRQREIPPPGCCAPRCEQTTAAEVINSAEASRSARTPSSSGLPALNLTCERTCSRARMPGHRQATWTQTAKLYPEAFTATQGYGTSVSVDGNARRRRVLPKEKASVFVRDTPGDPTSSWATGGDPRDRRRRQTRSRQRQGRCEGLQPLRRRAR